MGGQVTFRENDVYRWAWTPEFIMRGRGLALPTDYHAKSQIGIIRGGRFIDTYWDPIPTFCLTLEQVKEALDLQYLGNLDDYVKIDDSTRRFFAKCDLLDLNHSNSTSGNLYLRKGAARDRTTLILYAKEQVELCKRITETAQHNLERMVGVLHDLEGGCSLEDIRL